MTPQTPAKLTPADLKKYPHLAGKVQDQPAPAPAQAPGPERKPDPAAERSYVTIHLPHLPRGDTWRAGVYGFAAGVIFLGMLMIVTGV